MSKAIYFVAILPPEEIRREVYTFKCYARDHFNSSRALRSPAHITLEPPFKWEDDRTGELIKSLESFKSPVSGFTVELRNFATFPPRVIFVDVIPNPALLQLQSALRTFFHGDLGIESDRPEWPFHPHMTVAFKDLRKSVFPQARDYFISLQYERAFEVRSIWLLRHDGKRWVPQRKIVLQ